MYGLVNKALQDLVRSRHGEGAWGAIQQEAGVEIEEFICMEKYPDHITYALVSATAKLLELDPSSVLEAFGEHWIQFTAREGYGSLLDQAGKTPFEVLVNLDSLHARVGLSYPDLRPPSFRTSGRQEDSIVLHYRSQRVGLAPFVQGLIRGIGKSLGEDLTVEVLSATEADDARETQFLVERILTHDATTACGRRGGGAGEALR